MAQPTIKMLCIGLCILQLVSLGIIAYLDNSLRTASHLLEEAFTIQQMQTSQLDRCTSLKTELVDYLGRVVEYLHSMNLELGGAPNRR